MGISGPALQSVITENVPANEQGEIQGTLTSLMSVTSIIGPPLMSNVFYNFTNKNAAIHFPGAPFVLGGILMLFSAIIAFYSFKKSLFKLNFKFSQIIVTFDGNGQKTICLTGLQYF